MDEAPNGELSERTGNRPDTKLFDGLLLMYIAGIIVVSLYLFAEIRY